MSKKNIVPLIMFIAIAVALIIWGIPIIKNRYLNNNQKSIINNPTATNPENNPNSDEKNQTENNLENIESEDTSPAEEKNSFIDVKREDCLNNCQRFSKEQELTYCRESCGLTETQNDTNNCPDKSGLEKDYCFKDLAVTKQDFKICEKISDKGIKMTCTTRITEDLLDAQMQNSPALPE